MEIDLFESFSNSKRLQRLKIMERVLYQSCCDFSSNDMLDIGTRNNSLKWKLRHTSKNLEAKLVRAISLGKKSQVEKLIAKGISNEALLMRLGVEINNKTDFGSCPVVCT